MSSANVADVAALSMELCFANHEIQCLRKKVKVMSEQYEMHLSGLSNLVKARDDRIAELERNLSAREVDLVVAKEEIDARAVLRCNELKFFSGEIDKLNNLVVQMAEIQKSDYDRIRRLERQQLNDLSVFVDTQKTNAVLDEELRAYKKMVQLLSAQTADIAHEKVVAEAELEVVRQGSVMKDHQIAELKAINAKLREIGAERNKFNAKLFNEIEKLEDEIEVTKFDCEFAIVEKNAELALKDEELRRVKAARDALDREVINVMTLAHARSRGN